MKHSDINSTHGLNIASTSYIIHTHQQMLVGCKKAKNCPFKHILLLYISNSFYFCTIIVLWQIYDFFSQNHTKRSHIALKKTKLDIHKW